MTRKGGIAPVVRGTQPRTGRTDTPHRWALVSPGGLCHHATVPVQSLDPLAGLPPPDEAPELLIDPTTTPVERERILSALADEGAQDPAVQAIARWLVKRAEEDKGRELGDAEKLQALLDGLHALAVYHDDCCDVEVFNRVRWTLTPREGNPVSILTGQPQGQGDCDCLASAFAGLARAAGLSATPKWVDQPGRAMNHVAVVSCGAWAAKFPSTAAAGAEIPPPAGCAWVETTVPGAIVGEDPYTAVRRHGMAERVYGAAGVAVPGTTAEADLVAGTPGAGWKVAGKTIAKAAAVGAGIAAVSPLVGGIGWKRAAVYAVGGGVALEMLTLGLEMWTQRGTART